MGLWHCYGFGVDALHADLVYERRRCWSIGIPFIFCNGVRHMTNAMITVGTK